MAEGESLFDLGAIVATPGALRLMLINSVQPQDLLRRHATGDWSDMDAADQASNTIAAKNGLRIFSAYLIGDARIWCITEADRSVTTFLRPEDY